MCVALSCGLRFAHPKNRICPTDDASLAGDAVAHSSCPCLCRTRQEFEEWSKGVAEKHGYTVKFWGAGRALHEGKALSALDVQGQDLGFASQVHCS